MVSCVARSPIDRTWDHAAGGADADGGVRSGAADRGLAGGSRANRPGGDWRGRVGEDYDVPTGALAARDSGLNILAQVRKAVGSLDEVKRVIKVVGICERRAFRVRDTPGGKRVLGVDAGGLRRGRTSHAVGGGLQYVADGTFPVRSRRCFSCVAEAFDGLKFTSGPPSGPLVCSRLVRARLGRTRVSRDVTRRSPHIRQRSKSHD